MSEFKDKIPAAGGKIEFLYHPEHGLSTQISGFGFMAMYLVAVSIDGTRLLGTVPVAGIGQTVVYPQPSVVTYIQSDEQGMWGRNCPACEKYFRTNHVMEVTCCPYCAAWAPSLAFISKDQRTYITAYYDAFARAYIGKTNTSLDVSAITDEKAAWHYSEEKQQFHFTCDIKDCNTKTDILGERGYCPRCGRTNARKLFTETIDKMLSQWQEAKNNISDRNERRSVCEDLTVKSLSEFEALAKHLRRKLLLFPMTSKRRKQLEGLNFQKPLIANASLGEWFDISVREWAGNGISPKRLVSETELPFIKIMIQKRHILIHNGGIVDQQYLDLSGDSSVRLDERISVRSNEAKRFIENVRVMAANLLGQCGIWIRGKVTMISEDALCYNRGTLVEFKLNLGGGAKTCRGLVLNTAVLFGRGARQLWILDMDDATPAQKDQWTNKKHIVHEEDIICELPSVVIGAETLLRDNPISYPVQDGKKGMRDTPAITLTVAV